MNLPPLPLIDGALFIDNSGWMEAMSTCSRLLQFKQLNQRIGSGERVALNYGTAIHMAMELRYGLYGNLPVDQQYYEDLTVILTEYFSAHPPPANDWRGLNWAMTTVRKYNERYETEEFQLLKYDEPITCPHCKGATTSCLWCRGTGKRSFIVELPFAVPLYESNFLHTVRANFPRVPVVYMGRIDLPIFQDAFHWTMDTKTGSQLGDMYWNEQRLSAQHRGYCWALKQTLGIEPKGYVVNAVRSKDPPEYVLNGTPLRGKSKTPAQWWQESLQRDRTHLQPGELDRWKFNTIDLVEEFFWHYSRDFMPMKTKWCSSYGKCQFYDVCRMLPEEQGALLASGLYANNDWTPLNQEHIDKK